MRPAASETTIVGEQVCLRPFRRDDLSRVIAWRNDPAIRRGARWRQGPFGLEEAERWLRAVTDEADASRLTLAVALRGTGRLVGLTNLTRIDPASRTAYFGVVIGERDCWGRGLAREALGLMRARAAGMGLRKLLLEVGAGNARAIALYRGAGFRVEGTMAPEEPGEGEDVLIMSYPLEP